VTTFAYRLLDVFTAEPFGGNPLAVFPDGAAVPERLMQPIASELNLSETTFVLPPANPKNECRVRIFTPRSELPFAGHPTIGTAFVLHSLGRGGQRMVLEENVGPIEVGFSERDGRLFTEMIQPPPKFSEPFTNAAAIAGAIGLNEDDLALSLAPAVVGSSGLPFLMVPLRTREALGRAKPRGDRLASLVGDAARGVYLWTTDAERPGSHARARMFAPRLGVIEDPATGSANGPFAAYLHRHGVVPGSTIVTEQGFEMGRPSLLRAVVGQGTVRVGGECVLVGQGTIEVEV